MVLSLSILPINSPETQYNAHSEVFEEKTIEDTYKHQKELDFLIFCESGGNPNAINPKDLDGTASYGILQFKPDTFYHYVRKYDILPDIERSEIMNVIFDKDIQIKVWKFMREDPEVDFSHEFPDCYSKWLKKRLKKQQPKKEEI